MLLVKRRGGGGGAFRPDGSRRLATSCLREQQAVLVRVRAQEMFESRGGRPGLYGVPDKSYGHSEHKATLRKTYDQSSGAV